MGSAIFLTTVPATIMTSACRGDGQVTTPKRSKSWWAMYVEIISMAQQASPKLNVHRDDLRAMANSCSLVAVMTPGTRPSVAWLSRLGPGRFPEPRTISVARGGIASGDGA